MFSLTQIYYFLTLNRYDSTDFFTIGDLETVRSDAAAAGCPDPQNRSHEGATAAHHQVQECGVQDQKGAIECLNSLDFFFYSLI